MNSRERVLGAINHEPIDRIPIDLGSTCVTNINLIAYGNLKRHLGLEGRARLFHTWVQVPELEAEVRERLHIDTVTLPRYKMSLGIPNAEFKPWKFVDGSEFLVPVDFNPGRNEFDDYIWVENGITIAEAPKEGTHGFALMHNPLREATTTKEIDDWWDNYEGNYTGRIHVSDEELVWARAFAKNLYETTDKAIVADYVFTVLDHAQGVIGWDTIYMHMVSEPKLAHHYYERLVDAEITGLKRYLAEVGEYIDVIMYADDLGHQRGPMMNMEVWREFLLPHHKTFCDTVHENSNAKVLIHTDGAVMDFLPDLIEAGVDAFNTVQTDADNMDAAELKKRFGKNLTFWGGGVDTHRILPFATPEQVREDVRRRVQILGPESGFVFSPIHNILGDVPPENIVAAYDAVHEFGVYPINPDPNDPPDLATYLTEVDYWQKPLEALEAGT